MSRSSWLGLLTGVAPVLMGLRAIRFGGWPHFGGTNLVANGIVLMVLALWAWPQRQWWSWLLYAFVLYFVGINDLVLLLNAGKFPITALPLVLGSAALVLQWGEIRRGS